MAKPYLMRDIGGDALECISDVVFADKKGKDGIIHISPFTCMPEIMSQNIFPTMRAEHDIPLLALIMDEQTGKAGYVTRLEAFVDLMRRKKMKQKHWSHRSILTATPPKKRKIHSNPASKFRNWVQLVATNHVQELKETIVWDGRKIK